MTTYKVGDKVVLVMEARTRHPNIRYSVLEVATAVEHPAFGFQLLTFVGIDEQISIGEIRPATEAEIACNVQHVREDDEDLMLEMRLTELEDKVEFLQLVNRVPIWLRLWRSIWDK